MAGIAPLDRRMNAFDQLNVMVRDRFANQAAWHLDTESPLKPDGVYSLTLRGDQGYAIEVEWQRHRGFGLSAGKGLVFGSGVDEVYGAPASVADRIEELALNAGQSVADASLDLAELRKLRGLLQKDVAADMAISTSGLAQMERPSALNAMQIATLRRLVASLGGELVLKARFPGGKERQISVD